MSAEPPETPHWYALSATEDVTAFVARWLHGSAWLHLPDGTRCMLEYFNGVRYVIRLPHKGTTPQAMASDARKAAACFTRLAQVLEGEVPPSTMDFATTFRHLTQMLADGGACYQRGQDILCVAADQVEAFARAHAAELASGALTQVLMGEVPAPPTPATVCYADLNPGQREWIDLRTEPDWHWYLEVEHSCLRGQCGHEWEAFEAEYAAALASGALKRVVLVEVPHA